MHSTILMIAFQLALQTLPAGTNLSGGPPMETAKLVESALSSLDEKSFAGSYILTIKSIVSKPDGSKREESLEVQEVTIKAGTQPVTRVIKAVKDGKDTTEERRKKEEERQKKQAGKPEPTPKDGEEASVSASLRLPFGKDLPLFAFSPTTLNGDLSIAGFSPLPANRKEEGMTEGRVAWRQESQDPVWIEVKPITMPSMVAEMTVRFEFGREKNLLVMQRTITDGVGGFLLFKRRFHMEMEFSNVQPATMPNLP